MKKPLLISLFTISVLFFLSTCKKDKVGDITEPEPCTTCQSVTEAKDYFAFKEGSWWVYEEETTLERDSVYVTSSYISSGYDFDVYVYSELQGYYYHYYPLYIGNVSGCHDTQPISKRCLFVEREKFIPGDFVGSSYCFFINYKLDDFIYNGEFNFCPENKLIFQNIYENYNLMGINYSKTLHIHELCSFIDGMQETNYYYSKGVGIIRKEYIDSIQVWNLVNYHIEH